MTSLTTPSAPTGSASPFGGAEGRDVVMPVEFLSKISHEIRTPLATMQGVLFLLEKECDAQDEKHRRWLQLMHESAARMRELADHILEWNRVEGAAHKSPAREVSIGALCATVAAQANEDDGSARVSALCPPDLPVSWWGNDQLLRIVLEQFLANALKFSPAEETVRLTVHRRGSGLRFAVEDCGRGIPAAEQVFLWQPFFRASNAKLEPGTGLGLMIAKRAATLLGGTVGAVSAPGAGTTFWLDLHP